MQMREASRRAIGRFDGRWAALNSEDEVDIETSHAAGPVRCSCVAREEAGWRRHDDGIALLWFYGLPPPLP